jgi:hypothetical protein
MKNIIYLIVPLNVINEKQTAERVLKLPYGAVKTA